MTRYDIEIRSDGKCDVRKGGRAFRYDLDDLAEAIKVIRPTKSDQVTVIEPDGYRHKWKAR